MPYAHRRSITESQGYRPTLGQIPPLQQMRLPHPHALTNRLSSPSQLAGSGVLPPPQGYEVSGDRRLDRMR
ncbi:uncharacterized protein LAESUDRAFT_724710 [Laetiporus sulphureus 93-53]|uniref:Uncharacterized protein n=1 Tax=Laetiporus sulphureus 93-53 TaxID=1314785 RepID=A0A165ETA6_9APHY|nr:uncharacterized protein LAESUDRAFT_724710 [Laetiporus sulphureus 93-53]KZT07714.1 hypothetical protein LAESUDRAFT_724710 [Laetiporus sulphureus 93-53]